MSNFTSKQTFVKHKFYSLPKIEIQSLCDFRTKRFPLLRTTVHFTLAGKQHFLMIVDFDDGTACRLDDSLDSLSHKQRIALTETLLKLEPQWRAAHPDKIARLVDFDRLAKVLPHE